MPKLGHFWHFYVQLLADTRKKLAKKRIFHFLDKNFRFFAKINFSALKRCVPAQLLADAVFPPLLVLNMSTAHDHRLAIVGTAFMGFIGAKSWENMAKFMDIFLPTHSSVAAWPEFSAEYWPNLEMGQLWAKLENGIGQITAQIPIFGL